MSIVYLQKTTRPEQIINLLERIGPHINRDRVFIKPNIVAPFGPLSGIVTDPELVRGLIEYLRHKGIKKITIGEAPGLGVNAEEAFRVSGFRRIADETGVDLLDLTRQDVLHLPWKRDGIAIPKIVFESYYINIPKLKTHVNTTVTLGLKNQKGLITARFKKLMHSEGLHGPLVDLARAVKPDLTIIDGIIGLQGDGPCSQGRKIRSNVLVASSDVLAADVVGCRVMGIDPLEVEHIRMAAEAGIGEIEPEVRGEKIENVRINFKRANEKYRRIFKFRNWRNPRACSMCGSNLSMAIRKIAMEPRLAVTIGPKFAYRFLISGIDVLSGRDASIPDDRGKVLCLGKCTKELAEKNRFVWVNGCPPLAKDIVDGFRRL